MSFQPSALTKGDVPSAENVYNIDESTVMENETAIPPSAATGHTGGGGNHGNVSYVNGNIPRALPSIHLYADVSLPNNALISPTSDYGSTEEIANGNGMHSNARGRAGEGGDETSNREPGKKFYFVLEHSENGSDPAQSSSGLHGHSTACEPASHKSPVGLQGSSLKSTSDRGLEANNQLYAAPSGVDFGEYASETNTNDVDNERGYINNEFHDIPDDMTDNPLYNPTTLKSGSNAYEISQLSSPERNILSRNNSESVSNPRSPIYANSDLHAGPKPCKPARKEPVSLQDESVVDVASPSPIATSPPYINADFLKLRDMAEDPVFNDS